MALLTLAAAEEGTAGAADSEKFNEEALPAAVRKGARLIVL
jgi:hypothetical protein